jgi:hypothetical protein
MRENTRLDTVGCRRICFIHMPKCAGTSLYNALRPFFPKERVRHLQPGPARRAAGEVGSGLEYRSYILAYHLCEDVDLVFGHYQVTERLIDAHPEFDFITVLRDPVARFISNFYYNQSRPEWADSFACSLDEFLSRPSEHPEALGHNYIRFLGVPHPRSVSAVETAKKVLSKFTFVGTTERMDVFCNRFQERYGLELKLSQANAGPTSKPVTDAHLARIRRLCKPNLELYEHAKSFGA